MGARLTEEQIEEIREIFDHFDKDGNGIIDREEFGQLLTALGGGYSKAEADAGFRAVDTNKNGQIEFRELVRWWGER